MDEEKLTTNDKHPILRIDETVHRPTGWWTPAVHELLKYLESVGFKYSPRVLGFDEEGREVLSYIKGESGKDGWLKILSDHGLSKFAKFLREYHDAVAGFKPAEDSEWAYAKGGLKQGQIICHGDFGPWNVVWQGAAPIGLVDWDMAFPAEPRYDILYALQYAVPFRKDETTIKWHHFPEVPDRQHRIQTFAEAYGLESIGDVVDGVADVQRKGIDYVKVLAERGLQPQTDWVADGTLEETEQQTQWIEAHRSLFE